jgi:hypothetical protein
VTVQIFVAAASRTASGDSGALNFAKDFGTAVAAVVYLDVTAAATAGSDTLNVYVQHSWDGGTTWDDIISFTQVLGNGGAKNERATWVAVAAPTSAIAAKSDAALTAGTVRQGPVGSTWRVKWVIGGGGGVAFNFSVKAEVIRERDRGA